MSGLHVVRPDPDALRRLAQEATAALSKVILELRRQGRDTEADEATRVRARWVLAMTGMVER